MHLLPAAQTDCSPMGQFMLRWRNFSAIAPLFFCDADESSEILRPHAILSKEPRSLAFLMFPAACCSLPCAGALVPVYLVLIYPNDHPSAMRQTVNITRFVILIPPWEPQDITQGRLQSGRLQEPSSKRRCMVVMMWSCTDEGATCSGKCYEGDLGGRQPQVKASWKRSACTKGANEVICHTTRKAHSTDL